MSFIRNKARKKKDANQKDSINRVLEKYVDFNDLLQRMEFKSEPVEFIDHPEGDILLLRFNHPIEENAIEIYTVVRQRFIDFELEVVSPAGPRYKDYSYILRIKNCSIALDKREYERSQFFENFPSVSNITTIKVRERENDFRKSLSVRMIIEEYINRIEGIDYKRVVFKDDKDIPPTVSYVMESGKNLFIPDTSDTDGFFGDNEKFFEDTNSVALRDELRQWLQNNAANVKSIQVKMLQYHPLVGSPFPLGYIILSNKDSGFENSIMERADLFIEELSERIRNGNLIESRAEGKIIDVAIGGVKIELEDSNLVDKLIAQNVVMLEMNLKKSKPLLISGSIVYVYKRADGTYLMGVDFRGSRFGPKIKSVLPIHIDHFLSKIKQ
jgi:hypothetical protein